MTRATRAFAGSRFQLELVLFLLIVAVGAGSRIWLLEMPNFKPVAALALFAGFFFQRTHIAVAAMVAMLLLSDFAIGFYQWQIALAVYGSMGVSVVLGVILKNHLSAGGSGTLYRIFGFAAASLLMSTVFFLLTNFAVWMAGWYPMTWQGLAGCYTAAIPFYRWTLCGDLIFTVSIVAVYQAVLVLIHRPSPANVVRTAGE